MQDKKSKVTFFHNVTGSQRPVRGAQIVERTTENDAHLRMKSLKKIKNLFNDFETENQTYPTKMFSGFGV